MGKTIFFSSHILSEVADVCTSIGIIEAGALVAHGDMQEMKRQLRAHRLFHVRVLGDPAALQAFLLGRAHVQSVVPGTELDLPPDTLQVDFSGDDEAVSRLLADIVGHGIPVVAFSEETGDLEDVFLQVTKGIVN